MTIGSKHRFLGSAVTTAVLGLGIMMALPVFISGCKTMEAMTDIGTSIGQSAGIITEDQAESISKSSKAVARSFEEANRVL